MKQKHMSLASDIIVTVQDSITVINVMTGVFRTVQHVQVKAIGNVLTVMGTDMKYALNAWEILTVVHPMEK